MFYYAYSTNYAKGLKNKLPDTDANALPILSAYNEWGYALEKRPSKKMVFYYVYVRYAISRLLEFLCFYRVFNFMLLLRVFKKEKPSIIYVNNGGYPGASSCITAIFAGKACGIKNLVLHVNNMAFPPKSFLDGITDYYINRNVTAFITASEAAMQRLISVRKFDTKKCITIPNTLPAITERIRFSIKGELRKKFNVPSNTIVLGFAGLLTARKGAHILLDAIAIIKQSGSYIPFKLFLFGEGEDEPVLRQKITSNGLENLVVLVGYENNIIPFLNDLDIFIVPSLRNEDFPYVVLEAMLMAKPVIGTMVAGIPEQIENNKNGLIIPPNDAKALAEAILKLLNNEDARIQMGKNSLHRYLELFSNKLIMQQYFNLFNKLTTVHNG